MNKASIFAIRFYKKHISEPLVKSFGGGCRFTPTCSEYTIEALEKYGFLKGIFLGVKRLLKCHPLGGLGYDPVK